MDEEDAPQFTIHNPQSGTFCPSSSADNRQPTADNSPQDCSSIRDPKSNIQKAAEDDSSYDQILRSSSIIGGATAINYVIGMLRTKTVAVLLGPSGVGLVGLYVSITGLASTIAQLGIDQSGVREVAEANGTDDRDSVARVVTTLQRACWITGMVGWMLTVVLAWPLSQWTFGSPDRMWAVAILGSTVLIGAVTGGQTALLQGMRRIGDLARIQVLSGIVSTLVAIILYACFREKAIVAVIILTTLIQLGFSWYFSRMIHLARVPQSWAESARQSRRLIGLGAAFAYGLLLSAIVGVLIRSLIVREVGIDANGIYQAAWGLSGMFATFILGTMGSDFYPRLTAVAHDDEQTNRLVNEQTEIGILLALPGLLASLGFAPWLLQTFYSAKFLSGSTLLPWFVLGVFGQVITWPIGMIQMAKGARGWLYFGATEGNLIFLGLTAWMIKVLGFQGVAPAFTIYICIHGSIAFCIAHHLSSFSWNRAAGRLLFFSLLVLAIAYINQNIAHGVLRNAIGGTLTAFACIVSLRGISSRLGDNHRIVKMIQRTSLGRLACGVH